MMSTSHHCSSDLEVTLLNIISFNKGTIDLCPDERLTTSDIIFLTKTQLQPSDELQIVFSLQEFEMVYNNNAGKFLSITICFKNTTDIISHTKMNGASYIKFKN